MAALMVLLGSTSSNGSRNFLRRLAKHGLKQDTSRKHRRSRGVSSLSLGRAGVEFPTSGKRVQQRTGTQSCDKGGFIKPNPSNSCPVLFFHLTLDCGPQRSIIQTPATLLSIPSLLAVFPLPSTLHSPLMSSLLPSIPSSR